MQTLPISQVRDRLNELVDDARLTHEQVVITKNGTPAAILVAAEEWEQLQETLFWLSQPGIRDDVAAGRAEHAAGETVGEDDARARYGLPHRQAE
jgi:prevent-host-death family protein